MVLTAGPVSDDAIARGRPWATVAVAVSAFVATFVIRLASTISFSNDHFVHLTRAVQMLRGDMPVRDFIDPGMPLMHLVSAAGQAIGGLNLLPEALIVATAFAAAASVTVVALRQWTGSLTAAAWATGAEVAVFPRSYCYPKMLLYAAAVAAFVACAARPTGWRIAGLSTLVAAAFLFRHDHGLFVGAGGLLVAVLASASAGATSIRRNTSLFAAVVALLIAPYLLFVQWNGGLGDYMISATEFSRREAALTGLDIWPAAGAFTRDPRAAAGFLFYAFWIIAVGSAAALAALWRRLDRRNASVAAGVVVLAVCTAAGFLRDPLDTRVPDAVVAPVALLAWGAALAWRAPASLAVRIAVRSIAVVVLILVTVAAARVGRLDDQLERAGVDGGVRGVWSQVREVIGELRNPRGTRQMPSRLAIALAPVYDYVQVCTGRDDRLFVTGFAPEVPYYARRRFAGGVVTLFGGYYTSDREQDRILGRLRAESVPLVLVPSGGLRDLESRYSRISSFLRDEYVPLAELEVPGEEDPARLFAARGLPAQRSFGPQNWPCFR